jgi:hypothetical protein
MYGYDYYAGGTSSTEISTRDRQLTNAVVEIPSTEQPQPSAFRENDRGIEPFPSIGRTNPTISPDERGKPTVSDQFVGRFTDAHTPQNGAAIDARISVATNISKAMSAVIASRKKISMPANLQVLRRRLSDALGVVLISGKESNYASVITLIESTLAASDWKHLSLEQLREIQRAVDLGLVDREVTFDEYRKAAKRIRGYSIQTRPATDFSETADCADDEKETA